MAPSEFLAQLLPDGLIVIAEPAGRGFRHIVCTAIDEAAQHAIAISQAGRNCYFGLGSLKEKQIWNPNWKNDKGEVVGKMEVRVGANIAQLRCLFADIDIDPENPRKYASQQEAVEALDQFCVDTAFPAPVVVSSGGGLHCYWPLTRAVDAAAWRPMAATFKASLQAQGIRIDPSRTADASSVLRVAGTHNYKTQTPRLVEVLRTAPSTNTKEMFQYIVQLAAVARIAPPSAPAAPSALDALPSNTSLQFPRAAFGPIIRQCLQMQHVVLDGGLASGEPVWYASLAVARHCENADKASLFLSNRYPAFSRTEMDRKLRHLDSQNIGPSLCKTFHTHRPDVCVLCPHHGKVQSPINLGRHSVPTEAPAPTIEIADTSTGESIEVVLPNPPFPFFRREGGGIVVQVKTPGQAEALTEVIYDHDIYPLRRLVSERRDTEETVWRVKLPLVGWTEVTVPQTALANEGATHSLLMGKGVYVRPAKLKQMVAFMVAYIAQLQRFSQTESLFARLGWRDDYSAFVLDDRIYRRGGRVEKHQVSADLRSELPGLRSKGTLEGWKEAIQFYNAPDHQAHRFMLYGAFGSPLFHMTGHPGAIVNAYGKTGVGKTRTLHAINSVWGHPEELGTSGTSTGTTINARYALLHIYNNLPFCFDEITRLDPKDLGELTLAISQGKGKRRMVRSGTLSKLIETWALLMYSSANTDAYNVLMQGRRDATAEAMRVLQVPFSLPGTYTQAQADTSYQLGLMEHYGHAGHAFIPYIVDKYKAIQDTIRTVTQRTTERGKMPVAERFQSAVISAHIVGAMVARKQGLLEDFPIEQDWAWAIDQIAGIRKTIQDHHAIPREILSEFLEARVGETLVVSQTMGANIAPRVDQYPRGALSIRHEVDTQMLYLLTSEFKRYCTETGANYGAIRDTLIAERILVDSDARRVLGAGTDYGKGQVRCWAINLKELQK